MKTAFGMSAAVMALVAAAQPAMAQTWEDVSASDALEKTQSPDALPWARKVRTDMGGLEAVLNQAPHERMGVSGTQLDLPLPDGGTARFAVAYSPIFPTAAAQAQPEFQTFRVIGLDDPGATGRVDITPLGFHAMFTHGGERVFIDPAKIADSYHTYFEGDYLRRNGLHENADTVCGADHADKEDHGQEDHGQEDHGGNRLTPLPQGKGGLSPVREAVSFGGDIRTYRIAVAATGEYTQYFGGQKGQGLAAIVTAVNRLNAVFEPELAMRFQLIASNNAVVFTDPDTDPYTTSDRSAMLDENATTLATEIGETNFDIGHVFGTFGGGVAQLSGVCRATGKSRGVSGTSRPDRASFIRLLSHEVGHQFGAPHSFNGGTGSCADNRSARGAVEPHSGSTIMSYAGICGAENLRGGKDTFFHNSSLTYMNDFVANTQRGGSCATLVPAGNRAPSVDAGPDGVIPASTPFALTGESSDADGDALTHVWEQTDRGPRNENSDDRADDGARPLFRSFQPGESRTRTFPALARVLGGDEVMGETYATTDRTLTFTLTARDGLGGVADDERVLQVVAGAGPFRVDTPAQALLDGGRMHTVSWDVANTTADPVNCSTVALSVSTDGGQSFEHDMGETGNDGSHEVEFPNVDATNARLKVACASQPFFAINDADFALVRTVPVNRAPELRNDVATVEEGSTRISLNVLANDRDPEGDALTLSATTEPDQGGEVVISGARILYTPALAFTGMESFGYTVEDGNGNSASAIVAMTVAPRPNTVPVTVDDALTVDENDGATRIAVLSNDADADGDPLTLTSVGTPDRGGVATIDGDVVAYTPAMGVSGTEMFRYAVSDGEGGEATGIVTVTIAAATPPPPPPAPPAPTSPAPNASPTTSGGGSIGLVMLMLLGLRNRIGSRVVRPDAPSANLPINY